MELGGCQRQAACGSAPPGGRDRKVCLLSPSEATEDPCLPQRLSPSSLRFRFCRLLFRLRVVVALRMLV